MNVARGCVRIRRLRWLDEGALALTELPPGQLAGALRLIAATGIPSEAKVNLYRQLLSGATPAGQQVVFWKLVDIRSGAADSLLRGLGPA